MHPHHKSMRMIALKLHSDAEFTRMQSERMHMHLGTSQMHVHDCTQIAFGCGMHPNAI